ncbi:MAG: putative membrane protein [Candidatus Woesearchaeota archaeon]|jgi:uncharacterized membrane protein
MNIYVGFAFLSAFLWAIMNIFDKLIIDKKVKFSFSFMAVSGIINALAGAIIISVFGVSFTNVHYLIITGILYGIQAIIYYYLLSKMDASHVIGLIFTYPILMAPIAFLWLGETLSFAGYVGLLFCVIGAISMMTKFDRKFKIIVYVLIGINALNITIQELILKVATNHFSVIETVGVNSLFMGLTLICVLFYKTARVNFRKELVNMKYSLGSEIVTLFAIGTLFLSLIGLKTTVAAGIDSVQPAIVLGLEAVFFRNMVKSVDWKQKIRSVILITIGLLLLL